MCAVSDTPVALVAHQKIIELHGFCYSSRLASACEEQNLLKKLSRRCSCVCQDAFTYKGDDPQLCFGIWKHVHSSLLDHCWGRGCILRAVQQAAAGGIIYRKPPLDGSSAVMSISL